MASITTSRDGIVLRCLYKERHKCQLVVGGKWDRARKAWVYPKSPFTAHALDIVFPTADKSDGFVELVNQHELRERCNAVKYKTDDIEGYPDDLWPHQRACLRWLDCLGPGGYLIASDMGTGKSRIVIEKILGDGLEKVLVVAPKNVVYSWERYIVRELLPNGKYQQAQLLVLIDMPVQKRKVMLEQAAGFEAPIIALINYESVWRAQIKEVIKGIRWDLVVADECQKIRAPGSKVSKFMGAAFDQVELRLGLTGTPLGKSCLDAYGIFRFLDKGIFGTNYSKFQGRYAIMDSNGWGPVAFINQEDFNQRFHWITFRVDKEDVLDWLPEVLHEEIPLKLDAKSRKVYKALETQFIAEINEQGDMIDVPNAGAKLLRLQQVTSGYLPKEDGDPEILNAIKRDALQELLEGIAEDEPVVVFCRFKHDLESIKQAAENVGREYLELSGKCSQWKEFQFDRKDGEVLGVQIQSGGAGIDLTRARYCVFYSMSFSYDDYDQALSRVHRPGQKHKVIYYHLKMKGTIDTYIYRAISRKANVIEEIVNFYKNNLDID